MAWLSGYNYRKQITINGAGSIAGTIAVTEASKDVVGDGTAFLEWAVGDQIQLPDDNWYTIEGVTDATHLAISIVYPGSTTSGETYDCRHINYQKKLTVHRGVGADLEDVVYLSNHCRDDFNDVRFTKADGISLLDPWRERQSVTVYVDFLFDGIASADSEYDEARNAAKAFDKGPIYWSSTNTAFPHWVKYDLGEGITRVTKKLRFQARDRGTGSTVNAFILQGSNNDSDWTDILSTTAANTPDWQEWLLSNSIAYRYYRVYVTSTYGSDNYCQLNEIILYYETLLNNGDFASSFSFDSRLSDMHATQGVASDGAYLYTCSSGVIQKRQKNGTLVTSNDHANTDGTDMAQVNSLHVHGDKLYLGANNYNATPPVGYIKVFNCSDLSYVEEHQVLDHWCEGCAYYDDAWWVVYHDYNYVSKYNTSWEHQADYPLRYSAYNQGICWLNDYIYVTRHTAKECRCYHWTGSEFELIDTYTIPIAVDNIQGLGKEPNEDVMWFAERGNPAGSDNIVKTIIQGMDKATYWVEFDSIPADPDSATFYIYYGKADAESGSNGANTFPDFFEDFDSIADWTTDAGTPSVSDGILTVKNGDTLHRDYGSIIGDAFRWIVRQRLQTGGTAPSGQCYDYIVYQSATYYVFVQYLEQAGFVRFYLRNGETIVSLASVDIVPDTDWHSLEATKNAAGLWIYLVDGISVDTDTYDWLPAFTSVRITSARTEDIYFDYIFMAKYADPEPTWGVWGVQETIRIATVKVGAKVTSSRHCSFIRSATVKVGTKVTVSLTRIRSTTIKVGTKVTAIKFKIFFQTTTVKVGVKVSATKLSSFIRTTTVKIGVKVTSTRLRSLIRTATVKVGVKVTATRLRTLLRTATVKVGIKTIVSLTRIRETTVKMGIKVSGAWTNLFHTSVKGWARRAYDILGFTRHKYTVKSQANRKYEVIMEARHRYTVTGKATRKFDVTGEAK